MKYALKMQHEIEVDRMYEVKLDAFNGPLDLLLHLIQKFEIDIYDIPMKALTCLLYTSDAADE